MSILEEIKQVVAIVLEEKRRLAKQTGKDIRSGVICPCPFCKRGDLMWSVAKNESVFAECTGGCVGIAE